MGHHQEKGADASLHHHLPFLGFCQVMLGMKAVKLSSWYLRLCSDSGAQELFQLRPSDLGSCKLESGCVLWAGALNE